MYDIRFYSTKNSSKTSGYSSLTTIGNMVIPHQMVTNPLFIPTIFKCPLGSLYIAFNRFGFIIPFISIFSQCNADTLGMAYRIIFYYPPLTPMCTHQSYLFSSRRCPWSSGMAHAKSAHNNIIDEWLFRIEHSLPNIYFGQFFIRVFLTEISPQISCVFSNFTKPQGTICLV